MFLYPNFPLLLFGHVNIPKGFFLLSMTYLYSWRHLPVVRCPAVCLDWVFSLTMTTPCVPASQYVASSLQYQPGVTHTSAPAVVAEGSSYNQDNNFNVFMTKCFKIASVVVNCARKVIWQTFVVMFWLFCTDSLNAWEFKRFTVEKTK